jgi:hypothetical protein
MDKICLVVNQDVMHKRLSQASGVLYGGKGLVVWSTVEWCGMEEEY